MGDGVLEAIFGLYGVTGVHSKDARATLSKSHGIAPQN
jgi:hypothetical protein